MSTKFSPFLSFNDEKLKYKYYNKQITTQAWIGRAVAHTIFKIHVWYSFA